MMYQAILLFIAIATCSAFVPGRRFGSGSSNPSRLSMKMAIKEGDLAPKVVFKARVRDETIPGPNPFKWKDVSSDDLFKGKRVVMFALPGAFTPTCSSTHLPGYETKYGTASFFLRINIELSFVNFYFSL